MSEQSNSEVTGSVAIIGMAGRFPGAPNVDAFWRNLSEGIESIRPFTPEELREAGVSPELAANPNYVNAKGVLPDALMFDAAFFGINSREAEVIDPQQRVFLECAWEALESAGYAPESCCGAVGVFAGTAMNTYFLSNILGNQALLDAVGAYQIMLGSDKDFLTTRVSYKLNLKGPSVAVQTACSTSLVAVHSAYQALLNYQCDMALAGGVSITFPQTAGYLYQAGMILSPDGHCRPFDSNANGTVDPGRHQRRGHQQRWFAEDRLYRARHRGTDRGNCHGAGGCRRRARDRELRRSARDGHAARRSHRGRGAHPRVSDAHLADGVLRAWIGEDQHRSPERRRRSGGPDRDRTRLAAPQDSAQPALPESESRD
jgi:hypothetical protein